MAFDLAGKLPERKESMSSEVVVAIINAADYGRAIYDLDLYAVPELERPIIALIPPQYRRVHLFASFIDALQQAAAGLTLLLPCPTPPFLGADRRQRAQGRDLTPAAGGDPTLSL